MFELFKDFFEKYFGAIRDMPVLRDAAQITRIVKEAIAVPGFVRQNEKENRI